MYKIDLALNNQQWLICHKSKPNQTKQNITPKNKIILSKKKTQAYHHFLE